MTGLPGWIRFGFSPGWGGLPPTAQYLQQTGQVPQFMNYMQQQVPITPMQTMPMGMPMAPTPQMTKEQEIAMLEQQADMLEQQMEAIRKRLEELKKEE